MGHPPTALDGETRERTQEILLWQKVPLRQENLASVEYFMEVAVILGKFLILKTGTTTSFPPHFSEQNNLSSDGTPPSPTNLIDLIFWPPQENKVSGYAFYST